MHLEQSRNKPQLCGYRLPMCLIEYERFIYLQNLLQYGGMNTTRSTLCFM